MTDRLVSIVLPTYNRAQHLSKAVDSIRQQTYQNWELIIVDDGSPDDTQAVVAQLVQQDKRIRGVLHEQNKGIPGGLNTGFEHANGDYITWTSDDNFYRAPAIETMVQELNQHPEVGIVYADYSLIDSQGQVIRYRRVPPPNDLVHIAAVGACFMYRRTVHETINGYDEDQFLVEDYDFWIRASMHFQLRPIHQDLYLYQDHEEALTNQKEAQIMAKREAMLVKHLPNLPWATGTDLARGYLHLKVLAMHKNDWRQALRYTSIAASHSLPTVMRHYARQLMPNALEKQAIQWYQRFNQRS